MPHSFEEGKLNKSKSEEVNCFVCNEGVGYKHLSQIFFLKCKRVTLIILIPSSLFFDFTFRCCVLNGEATNTNILVFALTQPRLEHTAYFTRGKQVNHKLPMCSVLLIATIDISLILSK